MTLTVLPVTPSDAQTFTTTESAAYRGGALDGILFPGPFPTEGETAADKLAKEIKEAGPELRFFKAVGESGEGEEGIAFAKWYVFDETFQGLQPREFGPGANQGACELLFGVMRRTYNEMWKGKPHVYLKTLHTNPEHQGRGAGTLLMKQLTDEADELGRVTFLEATERAKPLYEKFGFQETGRQIGDYTQWGGPKEVVNYRMVREPKTKV